MDVRKMRLGSDRLSLEWVTSEFDWLVLCIFLHRLLSFSLPTYNSPPRFVSRYQLLSAYPTIPPYFSFRFSPMLYDSDRSFSPFLLGVTSAAVVVYPSLSYTYVLSELSNPGVWYTYAI